MKKELPVAYMLCLLLLCMCQSGMAQYPFYFSSGNFGPPNNWGQAYAYGMGTVANTNIQGDTATAIGNCYFRFFSANSGGTIYEPSGNLDIQIPVDSPFALEVNPAINKAYYFQTFNTTDNYIFKTSGAGAPGNTMAAVIRIQGPIQYVTGITQYPAGNVYPGERVTITATISDTFSPGQGVYLRYSTDAWATSTVIPMTGSGTLYSATISDTVNTSGAAPNYYVFTSGDSLTIPGEYADLMTVNLYNNNFANFTYYVDCPFALSNSSFQMIQTDKARYNPSDVVNLTATFQNTIASGILIVKYWHLGDSIGQNTYALSNAASFSWSWQAPSDDYSGYVVQATLQQSGVNTDSTSIAIDVSSLYNHFPRYGFLSQYAPTDSSYRGDVFQRLNRYHLNAIQFYDVNNKHDVPLAGTVADPDTVWNDIANRENYLSTVLWYINDAHSCNMKAMDYNLLYGAWTATATADGVSPTWGLFYNNNHTNQWGYTLPATWASSLQVEDPSDTGWQNFLWGNESDLFQAIPYDGWHIDQLGDPGTVYDYNGNVVNVGNTFGPYITAAHSRLNVNMVMNAVTNYGQQGIASAPVDFLYTEVWGPYDSYNALAGLMATNSSYNNSLSTVLAAYMDQPLSSNPGTFNTPGVLLTDAVIFSAGGAHIELGDHMLDNPYFPNSDLRMSCGLEQNMIQYYDFLTGYENLLRDSLSASSATLQTSGGTSLTTTATLGKVWVQSTQRTNTQIFHLINLVNANTLNWRDSFGTQPAPTVLTDIPVSFATGGRQISKVFVASPDWNNGIPQMLSYALSSDTLSFDIPYLDYWTMVVVDYTPVLTTLTVAGSPFCAGSVVTVPFAVSSPFESGNIFTAQLSDSAGSFVSPVNIGTMIGTTSGTMIDTIPLNALHGTGYRIRVIASQPATMGSDNGSNLTIIPAVTPTISISPTAGSTACANQPVTFNCSVSNAGTLPIYQWKVNGTNAGGGLSSFSTSALSDSAIITCVLTSNAECAVPDTATSDPVIMTINPILAPGVSISADPSGAVCTNSNVVFTASSSNAGSTPSYVWTVNGAIVGTNSPGFSSSSLLNGDVVSCMITSSYACAGPDTASDQLTMTVGDSITPAITITASPSGSICAGTNLTFHSTVSGGGSSPGFEWFINGVSNAVTTDSFSSSSLGNGNIITCILTSSSSCASVPRATSNGDTAHINPHVQPTISISPVLTSICAGMVDTVNASITNGGSSPVYVWKKNGNTVGASTGFIYLDSLQSTDVITCTLTSNAACASPDTATSNDVSVTVNPLPAAIITPASSTTICQGDSVELSAPAGNTIYLWSNALSTQSIYAKLAGGYSVTVTDANACSAVSSPVNVTVNPIPAAPDITIRDNDSLFSTTAVSYQWLLNDTIIAGANNPNLVMTNDGNYQVQITDSSGCSNISSTYIETDLGLANVLSGFGVKLYPNPNNGSFVLEFSDFDTHEISISDELGRIIAPYAVITGSGTFDLANVSPGVYYLNIREDTGARSLKFTIVK